MTMTISIYVHIPFCKSRCIYCDFDSTTDLACRERYVESVCIEAAVRAAEWREQFGEDPDVATIYLGGGTPSQLSTAQLGRILDAIHTNFHVLDDAEVTVEVNPDDATREWVGGLRSLPVNRLSFGVQTFHIRRLRFIRRRHTGEQAENAVRRCQDAGLDNISVDLIYGFPGETLESWGKDIDRALRLGVPHVSTYALTYEPNTELTLQRDTGKVKELDEEDSLAMYTLLCERMREAGLEHYEISNFARPGRRSRHNSGYWNDTPYIGLGMAAHSYDGHRRYWNTRALETYIDCIGVGARWILYSETLTEAQRFDERVMTRLRTCEGLDMAALRRDFGDKAADECMRSAAPHLLAHRLRLTDDQRLCLTQAGIFTSNDIISDLMHPD